MKKNIHNFDPNKSCHQSRIKVLEKDKSTKPPLIVLITQKAFLKIKYFIEFCEYEINGLGTVERDDNTFTITDIFILDQLAQPAHVAIDPKALNRHVYDTVKSGGDVSNLKFQWHSHVNMPTFFSDEDVLTTGNYMNDFMISLVSNKRGQYSCRIDIYKPLFLSIEVPLYVKIPVIDRHQISESCQQEIVKHVKVDGLFKLKPIKVEPKIPQKFLYVEMCKLLNSPLEDE